MNDFIPETERRSEERRKVGEAALMQVLNPLAEERLSITILNSSERGMCIRSAVFLPRGAEVRVIFRDVQLFGIIKYCFQSSEGFRAGIELSERFERPIK